MSEKMVEPILGRMHPADPKRPDSVRTDIVGTYEQVPMREPEKSAALLAIEGNPIRIQLREDLPYPVKRKITSKKPYVAEVKFMHDRARHISAPRQKYAFRPGLVREVGFALGIELLTSMRHGQYLEEAPPEPEEDFGEGAEDEENDDDK